MMTQEAFVTQAPHQIATSTAGRRATGGQKAQLLALLPPTSPDQRAGRGKKSVQQQNSPLASAARANGSIGRERSRPLGDELKGSLRADPRRLSTKTTPPVQVQPSNELPANDPIDRANLNPATVDKGPGPNPSSPVKALPDMCKEPSISTAHTPVAASAPEQREKSTSPATGKSDLGKSAVTYDPWKGMTRIGRRELQISKEQQSLLERPDREFQVIKPVSMEFSKLIPARRRLAT